MQNNSNSLWHDVAKSIGSLKRLKKLKPRYGPTPSPQYVHYYSKISVLFLFVLTAAGVVPSSIVQIIFSFWPLEISAAILRIQKIVIG